MRSLTFRVLLSGTTTTVKDLISDGVSEIFCIRLIVKRFRQALQLECL